MSTKYIVLALFIVAIADAALWMPLFSARNPHAGVAMLDIGQGDATLVTFPANVRMLVDAGPDGKRTVAALEAVLPSEMKRIDLAMISHPQLDHMGGMESVIRSFDVAILGINGRAPEDDTTNAAWDGLLQAARERGTTVLVFGAGDAVTITRSDLAPAGVTLFGPPAAFLTTGDLNDSSLVFRADLGDYSAIFTGDIGIAVEKYLVARYGDLHADILKTAHHGSQYASSPEWITAVDPAVALISVGANNRYGQPGPDTLARFVSAGVPVYRTDERGTIVLEKNGSDLVVHPAR